MLGLFKRNANLKKEKMLAGLLLPEVSRLPEEIIKHYPPRRLPAGAMVTRIAPSPTGFMHIGSLYAALISERLGHQSGGLFYLRIEDTDKKREVEGAIDLIVNSLKEFNINIDEGEIASGRELGGYGPYKQSARKEIYQVFVKKLIEDGVAYPAFETPEELEEINKRQTDSKLAPGYYGQWATWRNRSHDDIVAALAKGLKPVIRLRSEGDPKNIIKIEDMFKGKLNLPENNQDIVILKSDGLPTYHFAHVIDDHLMGTTHVLRGDEWLPSLALHVQLFDKMGWKRPVYGHIAPIQKMVGSSRRKLSKRSDPEASISFYKEAGYPTEVIIMYLLNLANWGFEQWLKEHPDGKLEDYRLSIDELKKGAGALLDLQKIDSFGREFISRLPADKMVEAAIKWAERYDPELASALKIDRHYSASLFNIERTGDKARKDIAKWSELRPEIGFFFDGLFNKQSVNREELADIDPLDIKRIIAAVLKAYDPADDQNTWLEKMRNIGETLGYAPDVKTFKKDPKKYKGHFGHVAKVIRVLLVGKNQSPDLYEVMRVMGKERVASRLAGWN